jgi:uncharacterized membrane-anchored protein
MGYAAASLLLIALFIAALLVELSTTEQHKVLYWLVIILASLAGTTVSDYVTRTLGLGYGWGSLMIAAVLAIIFFAWHKLNQHVSLQDAFDVKTQALYWLAILVSSTLGTAFGDYIANATPLGFGGGALLLMSLLVIILFLALLTQVSREIYYWLAIIITHPMGAALGDFMTKPDGINLGNIPATAILLMILAFVTFGLRTKPN